MKTLLGCVVVGSMLVVAGCAGEDEDSSKLWVKWQEQQVVMNADGSEVYMTGCRPLRHGTPDETTPPGTETSAPGAAPSLAPPTPPHDFIVDDEEVPNGYRVTVTSGMQTLAIKLYTFEFLEEQLTDIIEVTTPSGAHWKLAYRGVHECDQSELF